jgi:hypothetical protein
MVEAAATITKPRAVFGLLLLTGWLWLGRVLGAVLASVVLAESTGAPASFVVPSALIALALWSAWIAAVRPRAGKALVEVADGVDLSATEVRGLIQATGLTGIEHVTIEMSTAVWRRGSTFTIGYPLLRVLRKDELRVAGAYAESKDSRSLQLASWARRLAAAWEERAVRLTRTRMRAPLHRRFMPWYAARLAAAAADLESATWTRLDQRVEAACGVDVCKRAFAQGAAADARLVNVHWPTFWARTDLEPEPPTDVIESLALSLEGMENDELSNTDTIGSLAAPRALEATSAADLLPPDTAQRLSDWWRVRAADSWTEEYRRGPGDFAELEARDEAGVLTIGELTSYASLVEQYRTAADALPIYARAVAANPDDAFAAFRLGALLLAEGDTDMGVSHIAHAMDLDSEAVEPGCLILAAELRRHGREDEADGFDERLAAHRSAIEAAELERRTISPDERLQPHRLSDDELELLRGFFSMCGDVSIVYLARKLVREFADAAPVFVVGVVRKSSALRFERSYANERLREELLGSLPLAGKHWLVVHSDERRVAAWFEGVADARIYATRRGPNARILRRALPIALFGAWLIAHGAVR